MSRFDAPILPSATFFYPFLYFFGSLKLSDRLKVHAPPNGTWGTKWNIKKYLTYIFYFVAKKIKNGNAAESGESYLRMKRKMDRNEEEEQRKASLQVEAPHTQEASKTKTGKKGRGVPGSVSSRRRTLPNHKQNISFLYPFSFYFFVGSKIGANKRDELLVGERIIPNIDDASENSWRGRLSRLISRLPV